MVIILAQANKHRTSTVKVRLTVLIMGFAAILGAVGVTLASSFLSRLFESLKSNISSPNSDDVSSVVSNRGGGATLNVFRLGEETKCPPGERDLGDGGVLLATLNVRDDLIGFPRLLCE